MFLQVLDGHTLGDAQAGRVVGDGQNFVAALTGGEGHLLDRYLAIAPGGMGVQFGLHIFELNKQRQFTRQSSLYLAAVFTQLGGDPGQPDGGVNLLFVRTKDLAPVLFCEGVLGEG